MKALKKVRQAYKDVENAQTFSEIFDVEDIEFFLSCGTFEVKKNNNGEIIRFITGIYEKSKDGKSNWYKGIPDYMNKDDFTLLTNKVGELCKKYNYNGLPFKEFFENFKENVLQIMIKESVSNEYNSKDILGDNNKKVRKI